MKTIKIYKYLQEGTATILMIQRVTGINLRAIRRGLKELEKADLLWELKEQTCPVSGELEIFYTSNPYKAGRCLHQLKLWEVQGHE